MLDGTGLTPFKIISEYVIILFYIIGLLLLLGVQRGIRFFRPRRAQPAGLFHRFQHVR